MKNLRVAFGSILFACVLHAVVFAEACNYCCMKLETKNCKSLEGDWIAPIPLTCNGATCSGVGPSGWFCHLTAEEHIYSAWDQSTWNSNYGSDTQEKWVSVNGEFGTRMKTSTATGTDFCFFKASCKPDCKVLLGGGRVCQGQEVPQYYKKWEHCSSTPQNCTFTPGQGCEDPVDP